MAGWKLRKDKSSAEAAPEADAEADAPAAIPGWDSPAPHGAGDGLPAFEDDEAAHAGGVIALGGDAPALIPVSDFEMPHADFEAADALRFDDEDDAPLFFGDTQPSVFAPDPPSVLAPEPPAAGHGAAVYEAPDAPSVMDAPSQDSRSQDGPVLAPEPAEEEETLGYLGGGIPAVAPFVMDVPADSAPSVQDAHRLVMRVGRLSASFDLVKDVTVIGRPDSALHYYPDVEIEMDDAVSRRHAEVIRAADGQFSLQDTGSTNGTRLNGEMLPAREERPLVHGDRIHVGERTEIIFE